MATPTPPAPPQQEQTQAHNAEMDAVRRLRVLEERFLNLRRKAQLSDEKLLAAEEKLHSELKAMTQELVAMRRQVSDLSETIQSVKGEMQHTASQHDLKAVEKYLSYWEPLQFVTKEELLRKQNLLKERTER